MTSIEGESKEGAVLLVHCVDTEGPLFEPPEATVDMFCQQHGLSTDFVLEQLSQSEGRTASSEFQSLWADHVSRRQFNTDFSQLDQMLDVAFSKEWRLQYADDVGRGYKFSWFILDHVGFLSNPRRRTLGYHAIWDHYERRIGRIPETAHDRLYWHHHPVSFTREAHKASSNFSFSNEHLQILARRLIDRLDFPVAFRPGQHTERPDINLFLEQWIPFDFGNQATDEDDRFVNNDLSAGRFGDWRRAPKRWGGYHPDVWDYQKQGQLKRLIFRCLNLDSRIRPITSLHVEEAFRQAADEGGFAVLAVTNHDERDMLSGIGWLMQQIYQVRRDYPKVGFRHANAVEAARASERLAPLPKPVIDSCLTWGSDESMVLDIEVSFDMWGCQPFFCFRSGPNYYFENMDRGDSPRSWKFTFDINTFLPGQVDAIGLAAHDVSGTTIVNRIDVKSGKKISALRNETDWLSFA